MTESKGLFGGIGGIDSSLLFFFLLIFILFGGGGSFGFGKK